MPAKFSLRPEHDYRIFFLFMTVVLFGVYLLSLAQNPSLRQPGPLFLFTVLMASQIALHWLVIPIIQVPWRKAAYVIGQGLLAFAITYLSRNTGMVFALYMALIGETIGFLGITRWGALATLYYLALSLANFAIFTNLDSAAYWLLTIIPTVIFIGLYVTMYLRQAEAREQAQALASELETANRQLTEYSARVEDLTIASERQRLARELHDTLSQGLAGLILQLEAVDAHLSHQRSDKAHAIVADAMVQARSTLADARRAIDDLRHSSPDDLDSALRLEIARFTNATGLDVHFHSDALPPLPDLVTGTAVRALAEALTNIARHAQAQSVEVHLQVREEQLLLTIRDDGLGFDPSAIPSGHYGILGIQERVRLASGRLAIQSEKGKGTCLTIEIPL